MEPSDDFQKQQIGDGDVAEQPPQLTPHPFRPQGRPKWETIKDFYRSNKWYVWAIVLGLIIIGALAFFALRPRPNAPAAEANVDVSIEAPQTAPSGSDVIYRVKLQNNDNANLVNLEIELVYSEGATYVSSTPKANNLSGTRFDVPDLGSGQNAALIIKVKTDGSINDEKKLTAVLHYNYSNFSSDFQKQATHTLRLVASDVSVEINGPQESTNAQSGSYTVTYSNNSDHDISNARVQVTYPDGFLFADSSPKPDLAKNIWNVGTLKQGGSGKISFQGTFKSAQPGQSQNFIVDFQVQDAQGTFYTQASGDFTTAISSLPLVVVQSLDNGANKNVVDPGETLNYIVKYSNTATVAASGVNIVLTLDSKALDYSTMQAEGGDVNNNTVIWNASGVNNLEHLNPNDSGSLRFTVKVKNPAVKDSSTNLTVKSTVKVKSNEFSTFLPGNDMELKISSPSEMVGDASVVTGQVPLKVGKSTILQVKITLRNTNNDFSNSLITGFIPSGVVFDAGSINAKELANVVYDSATGKLTWKVGILKAHTGDFNPLRTLTFNVRVSPVSSQANQEVTLFRNIVFVAKDTFTGQDIQLRTDDVKSTDIPNGSIDGRVQP